MHKLGFGVQLWAADLPTFHLVVPDCKCNFEYTDTLKITWSVGRQGVIQLNNISATLKNDELLTLRYKQKMKGLVHRDTMLPIYKFEHHNNVPFLCISSGNCTTPSFEQCLHMSRATRTALEKSLFSDVVEPLADAGQCKLGPKSITLTINCATGSHPPLKPGGGVSLRGKRRRAS